MKKLLSLSLIVAIFLGFYTVNVSLVRAECSMDLQFHIFGSGVTEEFLRGEVTVNANPANHYELIYSINDCQSSTNGRLYKLLTNNGVVLAEETITGSSPNIQNEKISLGSASGGDVISYSLNLIDSITSRPVIDPEFIKVTFTSPTSSPPPSSPTGGSSYAPLEVSVCKLDKTTATVCWKTSSPSNSEVEYGEEGVDAKVVRFTNFSLTTHSVPLSGLKVATQYRYRARSSPNANTASATSDWASFTTKNADGTGGSTGGSTTGTNANTPTTVSNYQNYDANIGTLKNPLTANSLPELITRLIKILLLLIAMAAVIMIIIGGFRMVLASGNPAALATAKNTIIWAIIGLVVALMSFSIVAIVQNLIQK